MKFATILGAIVAAVWVAGSSGAEELAPKATGANTISEASGESQEVELLFVQQADKAILKNGVLTLEGVGKNVLYFSDRPDRVVGREQLDSFIDAWDEGEESFATIPPNAVITVVKGDQELDAVLVLKKPVRVDAETLTYNVDVLEGPDAGFGDHAALFIDAVRVGRLGDPGGLRGGRVGRPGDPGGLRGGEAGIPGAEPGIPGRRSRVDARRFAKTKALDRML